MTCSSRYHKARRVQKRPIQDQITDSLRFLLSRTQIWRRWVGNYNTRTRDRIDLYFNLATQTDNKTNLEIASMSKSISEENRKDSLSIITLAAVTVVFLPGTFVTVRLVSTSYLSCSILETLRPSSLVSESCFN